VRIVSVTEHSSRRLLSIMRRLLCGSSEVEFAITYLKVNNASSVILPTLEQFAADADALKRKPSVKNVALSDSFNISKNHVD
jgi:hypothetical protein